MKKKKKWSRKSTQRKVQCKQRIFNRKNLINIKYLHREKKKKKNNFFLQQRPISYTQSIVLMLDKCDFFKVRFVPPFLFLNLPDTVSLGCITTEKSTILQKHPHLIPGHPFNQNYRENTRETKSLPMWEENPLEEWNNDTCYNIDENVLSERNQLLHDSIDSKCSE